MIFSGSKSSGDSLAPHNEHRHLSAVTCSSPSLLLADALPEGLVHELPSADKLPGPSSVHETSIITDDLEDLQRQLDALNAA